MAAAVAVARNQKVLRVDSSLRDKHIDLLPMAVLPDKKEWIAEHDLEMLMLDGYESNSIFYMYAMYMLV
jgi:hypothetical protein